MSGAMKKRPRRKKTIIVTYTLHNKLLMKDTMGIGTEVFRMWYEDPKVYPNSKLDVLQRKCMADLRGGVSELDDAI